MTYFPIKDLKRAEYNPRIMPDAEMQSLMKSIETHGFVEPIVVNVNKDRYGTIVGGHQRLTAIEKLIAKGVGIAGVEYKKIEEKTVATGLSGVPTYEARVPVFEVDLTLEAEKQLNIGLNRIHGKFDEEKLFTVIIEMGDSPTLSSAGLSEKELVSILHFNDEVVEKKDVNASVCERCNELKLSVQGHARKSRHPLKISDKDFE